MPLHLLAKKSWNVYNPDNIARVRADEAAAAAREEAEEQRMQEADAERRIAILRGVTPPPLPAAPAEPEDGRKRERVEKKDKDGSFHHRKRRRLRGEDDTDRDIRLAQATTAPRSENDEGLGARAWKPKVATDAPVVDQKGHINLFPVDEKAELQKLRKGEQNDKAEREKKKKEREEEAQSGMRFKDAGGRGAGTPWYSTGRRWEHKEVKADDMLLEAMVSKNVWGNEDPRRKEREKQRISSSDPFAFMQKAQQQLKQAEKDRKAWTEVREREIMEVRSKGERDRRRERLGKRKKRHDEHDLEGFSLDGPISRESHHMDVERSSKHRRHRSRSRSREHRRTSHRSDHRRSRSRSPESSKPRGEHRGSRRHRNDRESGDKRHLVPY